MTLAYLIPAKPIGRPRIPRAMITPTPLADSRVFAAGQQHFKQRIIFYLLARQSHLLSNPGKLNRGALNEIDTLLQALEKCLDIEGVG
jgi:hypothetical protein